MQIHPDPQSLFSSFSGRTSTTPTTSSTAASLAGTSSSSSGGEEEQKQHLYRRRRRRRRRRRTLSCQEEEESKSIQRKTARIETALLNCDRDGLAQLAVSPGGLLSDQVKQKVNENRLWIKEYKCSVPYAKK
jgi:hypothetical protein